MPYSTLSLDFPADCVARLTLNRPDSANALNRLMGEELTHALLHLTPTARALILTGSGAKSFCAGADLKERKGMSESEWEQQHQGFRAARDALFSSPIPVLAAVNGAAFGGGLELALACDFIYAADTAWFGFPEATLGIMPGLGGTQFLPRAIGERRARELLLTGARFSAAQAESWGMVNRALPADALMKESLTAATLLANAAPLAIRAIRDAIRSGARLSLTESFSVEREAYLSLIPTRDRIEGIDAFNEKRKAIFTGT